MMAVIYCRKWLTNPKRKTNQARSEKTGEQQTNDVDQLEKPEKKMSTFYMPLVRTHTLCVHRSKLFEIVVGFHSFTVVCKRVDCRVVMSGLPPTGKVWKSRGI